MHNTSVQDCDDVYRPADSVESDTLRYCRCRGYIIVRSTPSMGASLLPIRDLSAQHFGLIKPIADAYEAAARVCLDRHHSSPVNVKIRCSSREKTAIIEWDETDERTRGALNNQIDITESGAYACVIAAVELSEGLLAVRRAETTTGADYYVAPLGKGTEDLEDCWRLEISGTDRGNSASVERLLQTKIRQARAGNSNLPALAGVIGFEVLLVLIEYVDEE
jgi:hypothetical protein